MRLTTAGREELPHVPAMKDDGLWGGISLAAEKRWLQASR